MHRRWTVPTALLLLTAVSACGSDPDTEEEPVADVEEADGSDDDAVAVPVELSADLVDADGSVLGTVELRDADSGFAEVEVEVAGMTEGFHPLYLLDAADCATASPADLVSVLPPLLVLESGIGSLTTLAGPVPLGELVEGGATVVIGTVAVSPLLDPGAPVLELPAFGDVGSAVACGAVGD